MRSPPAAASSVLVCLLVSTAAAACSSSGGTAAPVNGDGGNDATQPDGADDSGNSALGDSPADRGMDSGTLHDSASSDGSGGDATTCSPSGTLVAALVPVDAYVMLTKAASMSDIVGGGQTMWQETTGAIQAFASSPPPSRVALGIQYFGLPTGVTCSVISCATDGDCGPSACGPCFMGTCLGAAGSGDSCLAADYATPALEIAPLPGAASAIATSLGGQSPGTANPMSAALQGAVDHGKSWAGAHPGDSTIAVLITNEGPNECDTSLADVAAIASAGWGTAPKVATYVIGIGTTTSSLNSVAAAGGTGQVNVVDTLGNTQQQVVTALGQIARAAAGCSYSLPAPDGGAVDTTHLNVQYKTGGGSPQGMPNVADAAHCPATGDAWYFDSAQSPTSIVLCSTTCATVLAASAAEVDFLTGCPTTK